MAHRIREAMREVPPMGGEGQIVEADETYIGSKKDAKKARAFHHKKGKRAAEMWTNSLRDYAGALTDKRVGEITTADVFNVLNPIWSTLNPIAVRVRGRIESVLSPRRLDHGQSADDNGLWLRSPDGHDQSLES